MAIDLNAIRARVAATTPGPWTYDAEQGWIHAPDPEHADGGFIVLEINTTEGDPDGADFDFIMHARQDTLALLDLVRQYEGRIARCGQQCATDERDVRADTI